MRRMGLRGLRIDWRARGLRHAWLGWLYWAVLAASRAGLKVCSAAKGPALWVFVGFAVGQMDTAVRALNHRFRDGGLFWLLGPFASTPDATQRRRIKQPDEDECDQQVFEYGHL